MTSPLPVVVRCDDAIVPKARYVFDTLLLAAGVEVTYVAHAPETGPWLLYDRFGEFAVVPERCLNVVHSPVAWRSFHDGADIRAVTTVDGLHVVLPQDRNDGAGDAHIGFDIVANAFYFLTSWSERARPEQRSNRQLYATSIYARLGIPQDIVDRYMARILKGLKDVGFELRTGGRSAVPWPEKANFAVVLSHDVDFIAERPFDNVMQGAKTILRHLIRHRSPLDAVKAAAGFVQALVRGRDPYSCVPEIIRQEKTLGVRSSFQIAVGHRHPNDVNYRVENDATRDYLRVISTEGFDLCLHGSYRSTEQPVWYLEEARLLEQRLAKPLGSRQHFLSFEYDSLFRAQEQSGIEYDMSMGYPDRIGPRAGFSFPYFPFCVEQNRPYNVLQIGLVLMDATLRGYMGLQSAAAWEAMRAELDNLRRKCGCASVVWHPIVFGGARDPGYAELYWKLISHVQESGGLATDGRTINAFWRQRASAYPSFEGLV